ncbi:MAG: prephenate dehydrogenase [Chloroflexi bacterium]|nr:prephenate dehydrogenase [Chloroflexota bacterium]
MRTGIIGLGAIGASLGLALRAQRGWDDVTGYDESARTQNAAKRRGAIREGTSDIPDLLSDADIIVLAVHGPTVLQLLQEYGSGLHPDTVVMDVASTKGEILRSATRHIPPRSGFVGTHPLVSTPPGVEAAAAHLFKDRLWCLVPTPNTSEEKVARVNALIEATGARPYFVEPGEHDSWFAASAGVPLVIAASLARLARSSEAWHEIARSSGPAYEQALRGLQQQARELEEITLTSGPALVSWLDRLQEDLQRWRLVIESHDQASASLWADEAAAVLAAWESERRGTAPRKV